MIDSVNKMDTTKLPEDFSHKIDIISKEIGLPNSDIINEIAKIEVY